MRAAPTVANTETDKFGKVTLYSQASIDSNDATPIDVLQPASGRIVPTMTSGEQQVMVLYVNNKRRKSCYFRCRTLGVNMIVAKRKMGK